MDLIWSSGSTNDNSKYFKICKMNRRKQFLIWLSCDLRSNVQIRYRIQKLRKTKRDRNIDKLISLYLLILVRVLYKCYVHHAWISVFVFIDLYRILCCVDIYIPSDCVRHFECGRMRLKWVKLSIRCGAPWPIVVSHRMIWQTVFFCST